MNARSISYSLRHFEIIFLDYREFYNSINIPGCYMLTNCNTGKVYVGQSQKVADRVRRHIMRSGTCSVTYDIRRGDPFQVTLFFHDDTLKCNLNEMERYYISLYDAYEKGYNKTGGNQ